MLNIDINEHPELEATARAEMINYLKENNYFYEILYEELSMRMDADSTEEEVEEELKKYISNMFVFAFQAVQEKLKGEVK